LLKGASAAEEIAEHHYAIRQAGGDEATIVTCGVGLVEPPVTVVTLGRSARRPDKTSVVSRQKGRR
jgi:16S rRNA (guanine527-N7)-methyltransferase